MSSLKKRSFSSEFDRSFFVNRVNELIDLHANPKNRAKTLKKLEELKSYLTQYEIL